MRPLDPRLLREARASAGFLAASVAVGVATAVLVILQAGLLADAVAALRAGSGTLLALAAVLAGRAGLLWLQEVLAYRSAAAVKSTLRRRVLASAVRSAAGQQRGDAGREDAAPSDPVDGADADGGADGDADEVADADADDERTTGTADREAVSTLLGPGLDALDGYFARYLPQLVLALVVPIAILITLLGTDLVSAGTVAVTLPLIPVFMVLIGLATQRLAARRFSALAILAHHFTDVVGGLATLKIFGRAKAQARSVAEVSDAHRVESVRTMRLAFLSALVLELLASLSVALVAVGIGVRLVDGTMDLRTGLMVLILAPEAYLPLRLVGQHYHASADGLAAAEQALAYPPAAVYEPAAYGPAVPKVAAPRVAAPKAAAPKAAAPKAAVYESAVSESAESANVPSEQPTHATRGLRVRNLSVRGVSGLSFTVGPGEVVALYGPSGSGKSSVLAVLLGLLKPRSGTAEVAGLTTWVPQRPYLFAGTLGQNVRLGAPDASDELMERAFADAALDTEGLAPDRMIGESGDGLSVGEQRRVAVARALLVPASRAGVVLLDEPTAGLDAMAEQRIADATTALAAAGRAVLLVTHRPAMLARADRVVTL